MRTGSRVDRLARAGALALVMAAGVGVDSKTNCSGAMVLPRVANAATIEKLGAVGAIAQPLFKDYLLAFELTSVLLLIAIAGAVMLGGRKGGSGAR